MKQNSRFNMDWYSPSDYSFKLSMTVCRIINAQRWLFQKQTQLNSNILKVSFFFLGAYKKLRKAIICFVVCVRMPIHPIFCPHGTTGFPLDKFSRNSLLDYFSKVFRENPSFIKIEQE